MFLHYKASTLVQTQRPIRFDIYPLRIFGMNLHSFCLVQAGMFQEHTYHRNWHCERKSTGIARQGTKRKTVLKASQFLFEIFLLRNIHIYPLWSFPIQKNMFQDHNLNNERPLGCQ